LGLNGRSSFEAYQESQRQVSRADIDHLLIVEERRKVTRENTISLYGRTYKVPKRYVDCRIWIKIRGNKLIFEANGKAISKQRLKP